MITSRSLLALWKRQTRLDVKFIFAVMVVLTCALGIKTYFHIRSQNKNIYERLETKTQMLGDLARTISPQYVLSHDIVKLNNIMRIISSQKDVVYSVIFTPDGNNITRFLDIKDPYINKAIKQVGEHDIKRIIENINRNDDVIAVSFSIQYQEKDLGRVHLGMSKRPIQDLAQYLLVTQLLFGLISILFVVAVIYVVLHYIVLRPLEHLTSAVKNIDHGPVEREVFCELQDEIGNLAGTVNLMRNKLRSRITEKENAISQLQKLNMTLESQIRDRSISIASAKGEPGPLELYDSVTGLPNRTLLLDRLQQGIHTAYRDHESLALLVMDLDGFKEIKESAGRTVGDLLLCDLSSRLQRILRKTDSIARLGGEEFAIVLGASDTDKTTMVTRKIIKAMDSPFMLDGKYLHIRENLGIALYPEHGHDAWALLQHAHVATLMAKRNKTAYVIYDSNEDHIDSMQQTMLEELRRAVANKDFMLYFQPRIEMQAGNICGVETFIYWHNKKRGVITPQEIIPMAEKSGLIESIIMWVLETALDAGVRWQARGMAINVVVNFRACNLKDLQFPAQFTSLVKESEIEASRFIMEIPEGAVMEDPPQALRVLNFLGETGVQLAIDDFGIGFSSLSLLKKLPVNVINIDSSFIADMEINADNQVIVHAIIDLAHNLGLKVVAQGIKNEEVWEQLKELGCDTGQGEYVSAPLSQSDLERWFSESRWDMAGK